MVSKNEVLSEIRDDKVVQKLRATCESVASVVPIRRLLVEAATLHADRSSRLLFKHEMSPTKLFNSRLKDMSIRARLVEMQASLIRQHSLLKAASSSVRKHILARYTDELRSIASTQELRKAVVDRLLQTTIELMSDIESAVAEIDLYVKDLDHAAFGFRDCTDLIRLLTERKDQIV